VIAHLGPWTTTHRRVVSVLAAVLVATAVAVVNAPVAQAQSVTCSDSDTIELDNGAASATVTARRDCWDGGSWFDIVVRDIDCDDKAAHLELEFYNPDSVVNSLLNVDAYRSEDVSASAGCGTEAAYTFSSTNPHPDLFACVNARNSFQHSLWRDCASF
jgi:hypothetical protein